jgi:REP element-mobilizing transposase RayT
MAGGKRNGTTITKIDLQLIQDHQNPNQMPRPYNTMTFDPKIHHRRSIRLKGYDYRQAGGYFVTLVTQGREMMFGDVVNSEMVLNPAGEMIVRWWLKLPNKFPNVNVDIFMPMPNHFHGIILIFESTIVGDPRVAPGLQSTPPANPIRGDEKFPREGDKYAKLGEHVEEGEHVGSPLPRPNAPLSQMIQWFKTMTTNEYIHGVKQLGWKPFNGKLWQRNYYEHIIRDEKDADRITRYIEANPAQWDPDHENPITINS